MMSGSGCAVLTGRCRFRFSSGGCLCRGSVSQACAMGAATVFRLLCSAGVRRLCVWSCCRGTRPRLLSVAGAMWAADGRIALTAGGIEMDGEVGLVRFRLILIALALSRSSSWIVGTCEDNRLPICIRCPGPCLRPHLAATRGLPSSNLSYRPSVRRRNFIPEVR